MVDKKKSKSGIDLKSELLQEIIPFIITVAIALGFNWIHSHNAALTSGETVDLAPYVTNDKEFPVGEYVHLNVKMPIGLLGTKTTTLEEITAAEDSYFVAFLDDFSIITLKVSREEDVAALNQLTNRFNIALGDPATLNEYLSLESNSYTVSGKLVEITDSELKNALSELATQLWTDPGDSYIRYLMVDSTAVRTENALYYIVFPILIVIATVLLFIRRNKRRKKKQGQNEPAFKSSV